MQEALSVWEVLRTVDAALPVKVLKEEYKSIQNMAQMFPAKNKQCLEYQWILFSV